jgi:hypothetical protein
MRSGPAATAGLMLALALVPVGCGEEQTTAAGAETTRPAAKPKPHGSAAAKRCRRSLGEFFDAMESLNNTVAVGLDYDGYLSTVNRVRATYAEIDADRLSIACLARVASPAEQALNAYIAAANTWGECLATTTCDPAEMEPGLQRKWAAAANLVARAQRGLRGML